MKHLPLLLSFALTTCAAQAEEVLRVSNWPDYIAPEVLEGFQRETGVRIDYQVHASADELDAALRRGERYDVVVPSHFQLPALIREQRLTVLEPARLSQLGTVDPQLQATLAGLESANRYAVPYLWGMLGIAVNRPKAEAALGGPLPTSWSLLFDPQQSARLAGCGIGLQDAPEETFSVLFTYRGRSLARSGQRQVGRAGEQLLALRREAKVLDNTRHIEALQAGELCVTSAWTGLALSAAAQSSQALEFVIPSEGAPLTIESLAIPSNAEHPELAYRFIDYLLRPDNAVRNSQASWFYSSLKPATPELQALGRQQPQLLPDPSIRRQLYIAESLSPKLKAELDRRWELLRQYPASATR
ncbi:putrescine transport system substrate-binding protein [Geopseudomonas sagittaria]|uniref:Putrescine-binding periplasmic protein n=1 Tax=Geopseudomonas sagittaria TaxID=1135990 RepID=A0A1I5SSN0_9GAMM|nr:extracellular solute-binding protein [Pseudomonas sagittaria]SFP73753.1 putrescine transport system substrate-binding protein [Pseudomonas sagittaria]